MKSPSFSARILLADTTGRGWLGYRPSMSVEWLALLTSLFFSLTANHLFFRTVLEQASWATPKTWLLAVCLFVAVTAAHTALLLCLLTRWNARVLVSALLLTTAAAAYYMNRYTIFFNGEMVRNILRTDVREASELLSFNMFVHILVMGGLPALLVWRIRLKPRAWQRTLLIRPASISLAALVAVLAVMAVFQDFSSIMRNQKEARFLIMPGAYLTSFARVLASDGNAATRKRIPISEDAKLGAFWGQERKPMLFVLVVGETTRAANWGLNGYARDTTPELGKRNVFNFSSATSCGTNTEVSVPCMFSPYGRHQYDESAIRSHESLLHIIEHAGIPTVWRDNQSGCKGVCDGLTLRQFDSNRQSALCDGERCLDEIMLEGLDAELHEAKDGNLFLVLHQLGNHGPAYYKRYPAAMQTYTPACDTADLGKCEREQIVNAYDNGVKYTDHFLSRTIDWLKTQKRYDTAMLYLSDHGESLGENGIYLHGLPYSIAPKEQTRIPMVMWMSPEFMHDFGINRDCLTRRSTQAISQDHLFHTLLGLLHIESRYYDPAWDAFAACRADHA